MRTEEGHASPVLPHPNLHQSTGRTSHHPRLRVDLEIVLAEHPLPPRRALHFDIRFRSGSLDMTLPRFGGQLDQVTPT